MNDYDYLSVLFHKFPNVVPSDILVVRVGPAVYDKKALSMLHSGTFKYPCSTDILQTLVISGSV